MDAIKAFLKQFSAFWTGLPTSKRLALALGTGLFLLAILFGTLWNAHVTYATLYSNLEPQDAASIVEKLKAQQIPHRIEGDGRSIAVPADKVASLRLELASGGLPRGGGVGFELFDKSQLGATEFEQQVSLRRALEGEITRSILTISGIESARVHLVMPERRLFVAKESSASASVVLKLRNPGAFSSREVAGIVHLVSAAVPGLGRDRVSVVSTDGVTLHRPETAGTSGGVGDEAALERASAISAQLEGNARSQLERVVGTGNAEVRIAVDLDTASREMVEEHYEPSKTALRSENRSEERTGSGAPGVAGVPGALANLPDGEAAAEDSEGAASGQATRLSQTRNWEVDKVSQKTTTPAGRIARLSIAVLLNDRSEQQGGKTVTVQRSPAEVAKLEELVKRAVGFNLERGDSLKVDSAPFAKADIGPAISDKPVPAWQRSLPYVLGGAAALVVLALLWRMRRRSKAGGGRRTTRVIATSPNHPMATGGSAANTLLEGEASAPALPDSQSMDAPLRRVRAVQAASEDPATAAVVIRKWLNASTGTPNTART